MYLDEKNKNGVLTFEQKLGSEATAFFLVPTRGKNEAVVVNTNQLQQDVAADKNPETCQGGGITYQFIRGGYSCV